MSAWAVGMLFGIALFCLGAFVGRSLSPTPQYVGDNARKYRRVELDHQTIHKVCAAMPGVQGCITFRPGQLTVLREPACEWSEIEDELKRKRVIAGEPRRTWMIE